MTTIKRFLGAVFTVLFTSVSCFGGGGPELSIETLGAIRHVNIHDGADYGVGLDLGFKLNSWVTGHVRVIAYSNDDWRGSSIDEGSLLAEATLFKSASGKVALAGIAGSDRDFVADDWGFSVGLRPAIALTKRVSLVAESRIRAWFKQSKDVITTAGLQFRF